MVVFGSKAWLAEKRREQEEFLKKEIARLKEASRKAQILRKKAGMKGKGDLVKVIDVLKIKAEEMKEERIKKEARAEEAAWRKAVEIKKLKPVRAPVKKADFEPIRKIVIPEGKPMISRRLVVVGMVGIGAAALYFMRRKKR